MAEAQFIPNLEGWQQLAKEVVQNTITPRMKAVAEQCNREAGIEDGFRVGTEGPGPQLINHDYRQTVITATAEAQLANAKNHHLESNFHIATEGL